MDARSPRCFAAIADLIRCASRCGALVASAIIASRFSVLVPWRSLEGTLGCTAAAAAARICFGVRPGK